jgi:PAS domain S-box-containing protein
LLLPDRRAIVVGEGPYALSALYVPMVVEGRVVGLLEVQSYRRAAYTPEDVALLQTVAHQIGLAIQNARLFQETRALAAFNADVVNSVSEGIIMADAAGRLTFMNPAAAAMVGGQPQDWIGRSQEDLLPPDQRAVIRAADRRRKGRSDRYELELLRRDGQRVPVLVSGVPRFDETGRFVGTLAVFTDISERKRAEEALRRYAERLQALRALDAAILAARSPEEVAHVALEHVRRLVPCDGAGVVTFNRAAREGIVLAGIADSGIPIGAGFRFSLVGVEKEIEASQRGEVLFVPDIQALPAPSLAEAALLAAGALLRGGAPAGGRGTAGLAGRRLRHSGRADHRACGGPAGSVRATGRRPLSGRPAGRAGGAGGAAGRAGGASARGRPPAGRRPPHPAGQPGGGGDAVGSEQRPGGRYAHPSGGPPALIPADSPGGNGLA